MNAVRLLILLLSSLTFVLGKSKHPSINTHVLVRKIINSKAQTTNTSVSPMSAWENLSTAIVNLNETAVLMEYAKVVRNRFLTLKPKYPADAPTELLAELSDFYRPAPEIAKVTVALQQIREERQALMSSNKSTPITRDEANFLIKRVFLIHYEKELPQALNTFYCAYQQSEANYEPELKKLLKKYPMFKSFTDSNIKYNNEIYDQFWLLVKPVTDAIQPYSVCDIGKIRISTATNRALHFYPAISGLMVIFLILVS